MAVSQKVRPPPEQQATPESLAFVQSAKDLDLSAKVDELLVEAKDAGSKRRYAIAREVNGLLEGIRKSLPPADAADALQGLLEGDRLMELVDEEGNSCRAAAVDQLLELGFPHGLEVRPADWEHRQANHEGQPGWAKFVLGLSALLNAGIVAGLVSDMRPDKVTWAAPMAAVLAAITLVLQVTLFSVKPHSAKANISLGLLFVTGIVGILMKVGLDQNPLVFWSAAGTALLWTGIISVVDSLVLTVSGRTDDPES